VGELTCTLAPLVFAELYRLLLADGRLSEALDERLREIGYDLDWLTDRADDYDAKWTNVAPILDASTVDDYALPVGHSALATWLLAGLRNTGDSYDLSGRLLDAVQRRMTAEAPQIGARPQSLSPVVRGWTLGMVAGALDPGLPMVLAHEPSDPHIAEAYRGLVEQVCHLETVPEPWPELAGTALYVRTGGLAEALRPPPPQPPNRGLQYSIDLLLAESKPQAPLHIWERLRVNWIKWVARRNVLTHVIPDATAGLSFADIAAKVRTWYEIESTVLGITQFICQEVSSELLEAVPQALSHDPWEYLQHDVTVWS
jgi:hypothetical protein